MNDEMMMRFAMVQYYCNADTEALQPLLADVSRRARGVTVFADSQFSPTLLPATAWVSPLHPPAAHLLPVGE